MKKYFEDFKKISLFKNIDSRDFEGLLKCIDAKIKKYDKNDFIIFQGEKIDYIGVVLKGTINILKEDALGERNIIAKLSPLNLFGEAFVCAGIENSPVSVVALEKCEVMTVAFKKIISTCPTSCSHHSILIENMIKILANKTIFLNDKIDILTKRSIREKIMTYLLTISKDFKEGSFFIPFSRDEFADYLCVNRSALSRELSNMKRDGIIDYDKNNFVLLKKSFDF